MPETTKHGVEHKRHPRVDSNLKLRAYHGECGENGPSPIRLSIVPIEVGEKDVSSSAPVNPERTSTQHLREGGREDIGE